MNNMATLELSFTSIQFLVTKEFLSVQNGLVKLMIHLMNFN